MHIRQLSKQFSPISLVHFFFFWIFCSVSILNHFYFRSAGLDYGLANQALYQFAHLKPAVCTQLLGAQALPYLAVHLSFWVPLLSPFYWIFGSYTLLLFQNFALIFCGIGLVKVAEMFQLNKAIGAWVLIQFYSGFAIYAALAFDYHDNVIGACFLPWLFYGFHAKKNWIGVLSFIAILISKENLAIWLVFVLMGIWFTKRSISLKLPVFLMALAFLWFLTAGLIIMPALNPTGKFDQLNRFSHLGSNLNEIVSHILSQPLQMFRLFYESNVPNDSYEVVKHEFLWVLFLSGGIFLMIRPAFLWMALPIFMQKLWNKELVFWGISFHYQIELAPIIALAILFFLRDIKSVFLGYLLIGIVTFSTIFTTLWYMQERKSDYDPVKENLLGKAHYQFKYDAGKWATKLNEIPENAVVCAQANLMPHLSNRDYLYHFPFVKDANYLIFLQPDFNSYPLSPEAGQSFIDSIRLGQNWQEDSSAYPLRILSRIRPE